ncbi:MAG: S-layer homology domain-containing protein [Anaerovorax sp.]
MFFKQFLKFSGRPVILSAILAVTLIFSGFPGVGIGSYHEKSSRFLEPQQVFAAGKFSDTSGHWAEPYINKAVDQGIIKGYVDGSFHPNAAVSRAEFTSMVNRALGNTGTVTISFPDVSYSSWYYTDVSKAVSATYVAGYNDGTFKPDSPISREEASVMIARFVPTYGYSGNLRNYTDYNSISNWASDALSRVNGKGYIGPYNDGKIHPKDQLTRGQTAKILCDIVDKESIVTGDPLIKKDGTKLSGKIYANNVTLHKDLGDDAATIDNCVVLGSLLVQGGGSNSVTVNNSRIANSSITKNGSPSGLLSKGETIIASTDVNTSSEVVFRGDFSKITVDTGDSKVTLQSGTVNDLTVSYSGRRSHITLASGALITKATVHGVAYFHGTGTITTLQANVSGITFETKPRTVNTASNVSAPTLVDPGLVIDVNPANKATGVKLDANITLTFNTAMTKYDGKTLSDRDISDFVTLRKDGSNGSAVSFSASINSAKKIITLNPSSNLVTDTKYYVIVDKNAMRDGYGYGNASFTSYFNTGESTTGTTFSPANGATNVPLTQSITITLSDPVVRYSNSNSISSNDSYLQDCFVLRKDSGSGNLVPYSARINSAKTMVTLYPDSNLATNQRYYVALTSNRLKTSQKGAVIPASSVTWTTIGAPALSEVKGEAFDNYANVSGKANVAGTLYTVVLANGTKAPTPAQVVSGKDGDGMDAKAIGNVGISGGNAATVKLSGLLTETPYTAYSVLRDSAGNVSPVVSTGLNTTPINLRGLSLSSTEGFTFSPTNYTYDHVLVPYGTSEILVNADAGSFVGTISINGSSDNPGKIKIDGSNRGKAAISIVVTETGKTARTYTVNVQAKGTADLSALSVNSTPVDVSGDNGSIACNIGANDTSAIISVTPKDSGATMVLGGTDISGGQEVSLTLESGQVAPSVTLTVTSSDGVTRRTYTIQFNRLGA